MLVQDKLSKKVGLAYAINNYINILFRDGSKVCCSKTKFRENFDKVEEDGLIIIHIVNGAYFNNKAEADWQAKFLNKNGYEVKRSFLCDTLENIIERISHVQN